MLDCLDCLEDLVNTTTIPSVGRFNFPPRGLWCFVATLGNFCDTETTTTILAAQHSPYRVTTHIHTLLLYSYYTHLIEACFFTPILPILQRAQEDGVYNTVDTVAYFARLSGAYGTSLLRDSPSPSAHAPPPPGPPQHTGHVPLYSTSLS